MSWFAKTGHTVKDSYSELVHKVTWPSRTELTSSAIVVMIASIVIAIFVFLVDSAFEWMMTGIYRFLM